MRTRLTVLTVLTPADSMTGGCHDPMESPSHPVPQSAIDCLAPLYPAGQINDVNEVNKVNEVRISGRPMNYPG